MTDFNFGLTATRHGASPEQKRALRDYLAGSKGVLHHGLCVGGDADGHEIAREIGYRIVGHPPTETRLMAAVQCDEIRPAKGYLARNRDIVDETVALIAMPSEPEEQPRGGTWSTVRYARKAGKPVVLILPSGEIKQSSPRRQSANTSSPAGSAPASPQPLEPSR